MTALINLSDEINQVIKKYGKERIGVVIGTTTTGVEENYKAFLTDDFNKDEFLLSRNSHANPANFTREFLGLENVALGVSTACTSGIKAFGIAKNFIDLGVCDAVVCGGVDSLNSLTLHGFNSLSVLSNNPSKPFDQQRDGINISEGAGVFVLSRDELFKFKLKSIASNCDAYHITQPNPQATQQIKLINELLRQSGLDSVDYINLHATATVANDKMEAAAIAKTLPNVLASGIKANIGHTLGAAGAIETGVCVMSMLNDTVCMQILDKYDDEIESINLAKTTQNLKVNNCLNLSFAFGGDNAGMIIGKTDVN